MTRSEWRKRKSKNRVIKKSIKPVTPKISERKNGLLCRDYKMMAANDYD